MAKHTQRDWIIGAGGLAFVLVLSVLSHLLQFPGIIEILGDIVTAIFGFVAVYFIYKATDMLGGDVARYISIMGIGLAYYSLTLVPHVYGHLSDIHMIGPVNTASVYLWQHIASIWVFIMISYGLYLFWKGGKQ